MNDADVFAKGPAWLFCPADRPDRYAKAAAAADVVIIDLEDAVAPTGRRQAREQLLRAADVLAPSATVIRINPAGTDDHHADLDALARLPFRHVMLAKAESGDQVAALQGFAVVALCETPRGVQNAFAIAAAPSCAGLMWGAEDLVAALGGTSSRRDDGRYRDVARHARSAVLLAAAAADRPALDAVVLDIADEAALSEEAADAAASGFAGKVCIHPRQLPFVRTAFTPSAEEAEWARAVLDASRASGAEGGVFTFQGSMVDEPVLRRARQILARAPRGRQSAS
ncbi:HpcH/HpaI aldolase/citrate lyase family protein [Streptomyces sp. NPDC051677]|uniref:HpcH/HpaI aldolase/citrate lyase family protein n=1 Tax=Streptomyces sp. NPDC051677 TaxID=3365669 RepID=UPI0037D7ABE9